MSSQPQPSLAGLTGMARRLVSEGLLPEEDVRKAMAALGEPLEFRCDEEGVRVLHCES